MLKTINMTEQTRRDIQAAIIATQDVVCIQTMAMGVSPHDGSEYESNPCVIEWLVEHRGWVDKEF